jgi:hypothetical protein
MLGYIKKAIVKIDEMARAKALSSEDDRFELVLELLQGDNGEMSCGYYFINHSTRCLFWLQPFDAFYLFQEVKGLAGRSHIST